MKFEAGMGTDAGQKRQGINQDYIGIAKPGWFNRRPILLALADGMGGYHGGEIASRAVIETFLRYYRSTNPGKGYPAVLRECLRAAHRQIQKLAGRNKDISLMGSTLVAAVLDDCEICVINVGDSRAYHIHNDTITQISYDQSMVAELVRKGELTPEEALVHPKRNVLSMSISAVRQEVDPRTNLVLIAPGDILLLCSDGLWSVVSEAEILYFAQNFPPQEAVDDLIRLANEQGGPDNISVIIARSTGIGQREHPTGEMQKPVSEIDVNTEENDSPNVEEKASKEEEIPPDVKI